MLLTQRKYGKELLAKTDMSDGKPIATLVASDTKLSAYEGEFYSHPT